MTDTGREAYPAFCGLIVRIFSQAANAKMATFFAGSETSLKRCLAAALAALLVSKDFAYVEVVERN